jgi:drug/metabolite transporter (DMT)-like permease
MAQTKKKRRSKHRGNAAGVIEARGRTGRKPTPAEIKQTEKETAAQARRDRLNKPPTWRSAANRAALAALVFGVMLVALFKTPVVRAVPLTAFVFLFYVPLGYYTDQFVYNRRQKTQAKKRAT